MAFERDIKNHSIRHRKKHNRLLIPKSSDLTFSNLYFSDFQICIFKCINFTTTLEIILRAQRMIKSTVFTAKNMNTVLF